MTARDVILARVAEGLRDVPTGELADDIDVPRDYFRTVEGDAVERFIERISAYKTTVKRVAPADLAQRSAEQLRSRGLGRIAIPPDLPDEWLPSGVKLLSSALDVQALDAVDGALTGCALAIAETGTIVLDGGARQGRRALSLVPDYHLCIVDEQQIVGTVPEAIDLIAASVRRMLRPVTFISGPSATSDIELARVEGVHGPRTLDVLVVSPA